MQENIFTVSEITSLIKDTLENEFFDIWVVGEISNISTPPSGHVYFTLKDESAAIRCVLFKYQKMLLNFNFKNGDKVLIRGRVNVYEVRGEYQIIIDYVEAYGKGKLLLEIEKLKNKLEKEGLFDPKFKKNIPLLPEKIVVITSPTGAAIKDILNVLKRRISSIKILIYPVTVQGDNAANQIIKALTFINTNIEDCDVIIIARGGGSFEDLMPFNNEDLARAIFKSKIPVITAIGHEIDYSIADFVADLRAPTPSAAAELVSKSREELIIHIDKLLQSLVSKMECLITNTKHKLNQFDKLVVDYLIKFKNIKLQFQNINHSMANALRKNLMQNKKKLSNLSLSLCYNNPLKKKQELEYRLNNFKNLLYKSAINILDKKSANLDYLIKSLNNLSPLNILQRGYSISFKDGKILKTIKDVNIGDNIKVKLSDGDIKAKVISKYRKIT